MNNVHYRVSRLNSVFDTKPCEYPLEVIIKEMQRGNTTLSNLHSEVTHRTLAQITAFARELLHKRGNKEAYDLLKKELPQFTPAGVLSSRSDIASFSGLICLEYDDVDDTAYALSLVTQSPHVLCAFRSLHGERLKMLVPINRVSLDDTPLTPENYKHAWYSASCRFQEIGDADPAAMSTTQLQAMVYDPDLYVNWNAIPVEWSIDDDALTEAYPQAKSALVSIAAFDELSSEYLDAIDTMEWKSDGWSRFPVPCLFETHEFDGWGEKSNGTYILRNSANDYTFHCFKCRYSRRYTSTPLKPRSAPIKLSEQAGYTPLSEDLETLRKLNTDGVLKWDQRTRKTKDQHLLILATGAGSGKSTASLQNLETYINISPTLELADEKYAKALGLGKHAIRHRSRNYNREAAEDFTPENVPIGLDAESGEVPCAFPDICNALAEKGYSPSRLFCPSCPRYNECRIKGYLAQWDLMSNHDAIFVSYQDDLFSDPQYRTHIETITKKKITC